ncbi:CitA Signal transduction histidine kinase regulating citrate malate metabolism [Pyrenophora tritici-repentis]|nr:pyruvate dehydrogenase kinase [Pyrenophora tritici-repentis]KAF7443373.1 pyruvate dehydrogenase kinase [Pyrenophora tritici-repentis]KAI0572561.1 pyruvate dehydrogenase kinase [Pyrenophora tritici-repentis]KAI0573209.1 pyruvate dehydrogenase kinase [Pyrenophora tritici-repentis]KAI0605331.1 pyruvate dehydrogenase kinase [Pyrenophora tritici-repentis]
MFVGRRASALGAPRSIRLFRASAPSSHVRAPFPISHIQARLSHAAAVAPAWRPSSALDEWVLREARPISLRQLTFFGRTLTESRLLDSANYCRLELPTRLAHRLRDIQTLPYVVVANPHLAHVYESYLRAFERFRRVPEIKSLEDNEKYCKVLEETVTEHATVIPRLAIGVLEVRGLMKPEETDKFMTTMLRSRISRRVIAAQHLALTETFNSPWHFPQAQHPPHDQEAVGEIFLRCNAKEIVQDCGKTMQELIKHTYGSHVNVPEIKIYGHTEATFPYILSHLEYIVGELLRNSIQAVIEQRKSKDDNLPPIEVLICETSQHVIIRISDQGGGIPNEVLPYLWSFSKGPRREKRLQNLARVPKLLGTLQELQVPGGESAAEMQQRLDRRSKHADTGMHHGSLSSLTSRAPDLRLGIGLPMSRLYAEYWAGSLEIHSLEGYGVDAFLQISKLGNKNERLTTRASMDAI